MTDLAGVIKLLSNDPHWQSYGKYSYSVKCRAIRRYDVSDATTPTALDKLAGNSAVRWFVPSRGESVV